MRFVTPWRTRGPGRVRHDDGAVLGTRTRSSMHQIGFVSAESEEVRCCTIQMMRGRSRGVIVRTMHFEQVPGRVIGGPPFTEACFILKSGQIHSERSRDRRTASL